jgi:hypothetical protein
MRMPPLRLVAESRRGFRVYLEIIAKGALVISEPSDKKWGLENLVWVRSTATASHVPN